MNRLNKTSIALAVAAAFGSTSAQAALIPFDLVYVTYDSGGFETTAQGYLTNDTATWQFDTVTGLMHQTGGTHQVSYFVSGYTPLYDHKMTGLQIGGGLDAAATSYTCIEGTFGGAVGASICGKYNFGPDPGGTNESTTTWGPGTAFARTMGGDDVPFGPQQNLARYDGMMTDFFNGTTLVLSNGPVGTSSGPEAIQYEFVTAVPVPPAVWLFGSALAVLGWVRRPNNQ